MKTEVVGLEEVGGADRSKKRMFKGETLRTNPYLPGDLL